ncbi:MAG TPA: hypothetical protein PLA27_07610 [Anaerolineales bacterium]|jgi:hypothetical protein|nr:hypothetical protein [Anaerolineales bacterium]HQX16275.1 hypothetical protein [Anaerolineales bacterium]
MLKKFFISLLVLTLVMVSKPSAVSAIPTGVGVIGDSATQPYQCIDRGGETAYTWTEILEVVRGVNFGGMPCQPYNNAWSGETVRLNMTSQTDDILDDYNNGNIGKVISMIGSNDIYVVGSTPDVQALLATYETNIQRMIGAGILPGNILIVDISQDNWNEPTRTYVNQYNAGLQDIATEKGTAFASWAGYHSGLACRSLDNGQSYNFGGQMIAYTWGNEYHNIRVADGHLGTMANGVLANAIAVNFLGIPRLTDAELLSIVNGTVVPGNPPPACANQPTATAGPSPTTTLTRTPTATGLFSPTPSRTPTATFTFTPTSSSGTFNIGETTVLGNAYSGLGNQLLAQQVALSQTATIQSLSYYVSTAGGQMRLGIYSNVASGPGSLMAQTTAFTPVTGWNTQAVVTPTQLTAGTYWLAFLPQNNTLAGRVNPSGEGRYYSYTFGAMPATYSTSPTNSAFTFSFYATFSTGAVASNTPSITPLPTNSPTRTPTLTNTPIVPTNTSTLTATITNTPLPANTATNTLLPSNTPANTATITTTETLVTPPTLVIPTIPTNTPIPSLTPSRTPTSTQAPSNTPSRTPTASRTPTRTFTPSSSTITIGETSVLSMNYSGMGNRLIAQQVTLSQSATIQSLSYYVATTGGQLRLGIYNNSGSAPGALVAQTAAFTPVAGWNTQAVTTPLSLSPGTYWLVFLPQNNTLAGRLGQSGIGRHYSYTFGAMPSTYSTSYTGDTFHFSFYATLSLP